MQSFSLSADASGAGSAAQTGALQVARNLIKEKGIGGIYRGFGATMMRYAYSFCPLMLLFRK